MDATRRVISRWLTVLAAVLGAMIAIPVAVLLALAYYLRAAAFSLVAFARILGVPAKPEPRRRGASPKNDQQPGRMAS